VTAAEDRKQLISSLAKYFRKPDIVLANADVLAV
jgi:hypothetical protein